VQCPLINRKNRKFWEWLRRYVYPLIFATLAEIISAIFVYYLFRNLILSAVIATIAGNVIFYFTLAYRDIKQRKSEDKKITIISVFKVARNLIIEFGPAEYLDSYISRPFLLVICPMFITPYFLGATVGSIMAEIFYVVFVLSSYEFRKKLLKD